MRHANDNIPAGAKANGYLLWPRAFACRQAASNSGDAGHGVVGSSKLRLALKLTVFVRGIACESAQSAAPTREKGE